MSFKLKHLLSTLVAGGSLAAGVYGWGFSDKEGAEKILKDNKFTVLRYDGHALINRHHGEMYNDKFRVTDSAGLTREVVVAQTFNKKSYQIRDEITSRCDREPLPPYNPFKIPSY